MPTCSAPHRPSPSTCAASSGSPSTPRPPVQTVAAVVGALLAGVEVVPVPPDAGPVERDHILRDSAAAAWLGAAPEGTPLPVLPIDLGERTAYQP